MTTFELKRRAIVSHSEANDARALEHRLVRYRSSVWLYDGPMPSVARQVAMDIERMHRLGWTEAWKAVY